MKARVWIFWVVVILLALYGVYYATTLYSRAAKPYDGRVIDQYPAMWDNTPAYYLVVREGGTGPAHTIRVSSEDYYGTGVGSCVRVVSNFSYGFRSATRIDCDIVPRYPNARELEATSGPLATAESMAYPLPTPSLMPDQVNIIATCEAYYLPTLQAVEDDLWTIQQILVPGAGTLVAELLKIPTRTPVGPSTSPTSTGTTVPSTPTPWGTQTRVPTPTYTPVSPFLCARLTADGCAKYGLIVKDCLSGYGAVCVRASNPNGDCQWCKNYRP